MEYMDLGSGRGSAETRERISPREGEMIKYRDMRAPLRFDLLTGDVIEGVVRWFDGMSIGVTTADRSEVTIFYSAIATYRPRPAAQ